MRFLIFFFWVVVAVFLQVLLFNHLSFYGGIVIIYLAALLKMPTDIKDGIQILLAFIVGITVDIFCNTLGMHAFASITVMLCRDRLLDLFYNDQGNKTGTLGVNRLGLLTYLRYALAFIFLHTILLYGIESFSLFNFTCLLLKIIISTLLTLAFCFTIELASLKK